MPGVEETCRGSLRWISPEVHHSAAYVCCVTAAPLLVSKLSDFSLSPSSTHTTHTVTRGSVANLSGVDERKGRLGPLEGGSQSQIAPPWQVWRSGAWSEKSDVWAFAVVLWELHSYTVPYGRLTTDKEVRCGSHVLVILLYLRCPVVSSDASSIFFLQGPTALLPEREGVFVDSPDV